MNGKVLIIAEAGVNHNGDLQMAKELIRTAKECGADIVKFQTWVTEELITEDAAKADYQKEDNPNESQYDMLKRLELSFEDFKQLKSYSDMIGIQFLSTPDDERSLEFLVEQLGMKLIKIGSGEVTNIPYLIKIGKKGIPVILSTGMSYLSEVETAYYTLVNSGSPEVIILHCTSNYPASYSSVNLKAMCTIRDALKVQVGYSDHTEGSEVSIAAVAMGAKVIEKHFTLDKTLPGPDHKASLNPEELRMFVRQIRNAEMAISGDGRKIPLNEEIEIKKVVQKGIYFNKELKAGSVITLEDISFKRPVGKGISSAQFQYIVGRLLLKDVKRDELVGLNIIQ